MSELKQTIRINKAIASSGITSRRKADELIKHGKVKVNGKIITELGYKVSDSDEIEISGRKIQKNQNKYLVFYKPAGCITTRNDELGRKTIFNYLPLKYHDLKPVGRLDRETEGLLILTNDGNYINNVLHPRYKIKKTYEVIIEERLDKNQINEVSKKFLEGVIIDGTLCKADSINHKTRQKSSQMKQTTFEVVIHQGKNRQIRRMFQIFGFYVKALKRIEIGSFNLQNLKKGQFTELDRNSAYALFEEENNNIHPK